MGRIVRDKMHYGRRDVLWDTKRHDDSIWAHGIYVERYGFYVLKCVIWEGILKDCAIKIHFKNNSDTINKHNLTQV